MPPLHKRYVTVYVLAFYHGRVLLVRLILAAIGAALVAGILLHSPLLEGGYVAAATGPCDPQSPGVSAKEGELFALVNSWRADNFGDSSIPLAAHVNAAAQWFAEAMIEGTTSGHDDQFGRLWGDRLEDCGFPGVSGVTFASGESLAGFGSSNPSIGSTPSEALALMTAHEGSGLYAPWEWTCGGVGYATNPSPSTGDLRYAWVVIGIFQFSPCSVGATPTTAPPATPTVLPTVAPTPDPNSTARRGTVPLVTRGAD